MTLSQNNPNDTFWLARYAHNKLAPLFAQAKAIEPTIKFDIELTFAETDSVHHGNHVAVTSHWDRSGMFQMSTWLYTKEDVDQFIATVTADVAALKPLETGVPA